MTRSTRWTTSSPGSRQLLAGGAVEWQSRAGDARFDYEREVDRDTRNFVSERMALSATIRPLTGWSLTGGAEYDIARGWWGSADLTLRHSAKWFGGSVGVRRYRPYFDLWTLWGVFSPITVLGRQRIALGIADARPDPPRRRRALLVSRRRSGNPAARRGNRRLALERGGSYSISSARQPRRGLSGRLRTRRGLQGPGRKPQRAGRPALTVTAEAGHLDRPLEFRAEDPALTWYGFPSISERPNDSGSASVRPATMRIASDPMPRASTGPRPGSAPSLSWLFGSSADRLPAAGCPTRGTAMSRGPDRPRRGPRDPG